MNSKEAKQYINCIVLSYGQCFPMEIDYIRNTLSKHPIVLYKYQKFKKHTFETIRKNALYLPIPKLFDDPFDCLADFALENLYDEKQTNISGYLLKHILKQAIPTFCETSELRALKQDVIKAMKQTGDYKNAYELICKSKLDSGQFNTAKTFLDNCSITVDKFLTDSNFNEYANAAKEPSKVVGIGCLSETKNNKVIGVMSLTDFFLKKVDIGF